MVLKCIPGKRPSETVSLIPPLGVPVQPEGPPGGGRLIGRGAYGSGCSRGRAEPLDILAGGGGGGGPGGHARGGGGAVGREAPLHGPRRAGGRLGGGPCLGLHLRLEEVMGGEGRGGERAETEEERGRESQRKRERERE